MLKTVATLLAIIIIAASTTGCAEKGADNMDGSPEQKTTINAQDQPAQSEKYEKATFAAGCFWGVEASFRALEGVVATQVGYTAGHLEKPTYDEVCTDKTGHAEAVEVTYDPGIVSYEELLEIFWKIHDPTTLNRQGPDVGTQYRSVSFHHTPAQQQAAEASKAKLDRSGRLSRPVVTQIVPAAAFYEAEEYHQRYLEKRGKASCHPSLR